MPGRETGNPRFPLKGSFEGDMEIDIDVEVDVDVDSYFGCLATGDFKVSSGAA